MPSVDLSGVTIHYTDRPGSGCPNASNVVYLHGAGGCGRIWSRHIDLLDPAHRAVSLDHPGHGTSSGPAPKEIVSYSEILRRFVRTLSLEPTVLVGHSMGGAVALRTAIDDPALVDRLVLVGTGAKLKVAPMILESLKTTVDQPGPAGAMECFAFSPFAPEHIVDDFVTMVSETHPASRLSAFLACNNFDAMEEVGGIGKKTLVVVGADDQLTPVKYARFLSDRLDNATIEVIDKAGHMVMLEQCEAFSCAVNRFLA